MRPTVSASATCKHCGQLIEQADDGSWFDPEPEGDDAIWRDVCESHDTFVADHEPEEE